MRNLSGIYAVIAELPQAMDIPLGQRRKDHFENGFYAHVGSALNGLATRLARHLGSRKRLHWHTDYLYITISYGLFWPQIEQEPPGILPQAIADNVSMTSPVISFRRS